MLRALELELELELRTSNLKNTFLVNHVKDKGSRIFGISNYWRGMIRNENEYRFHCHFIYFTLALFAFQKLILIQNHNHNNW